MARTRGNNNSWGDYWADAPPESCAALLPEDARRDIETVWRNAFTALDEGASVLDIATGRGAVLRIAAACRSDLILLGVDSAPSRSIAPSAADAARFGIRGDVDAAALPFPDRAFSLVASQFGLEYAGFERAMPEAMRVCGERLLLLVHATDGIVVRQNAAEADQIAWALDSLRLFEKLKAGFQTHSDESGAEVEGALTLIGRRRDDTENPRLLETIIRGARQLQTIAAQHGGETAINAAGEVETRMRNHAARMSALAAAALSANDCSRALRRIGENGFAEQRVRDARSANGDALVGRWIEAVRKA